MPGFPVEERLQLGDGEAKSFNLGDWLSNLGNWGDLGGMFDV